MHRGRGVKKGSGDITSKIKPIVIRMVVIRKVRVEISIFMVKIAIKFRR